VFVLRPLPDANKDDYNPTFEQQISVLTQTGMSVTVSVYGVYYFKFNASQKNATPSFCNNFGKCGPILMIRLSVYCILR